MKINFFNDFDVKHQKIRNTGFSIRFIESRVLEIVFQKYTFALKAHRDLTCIFVSHSRHLNLYTAYLLNKFLFFFLFHGVARGFNY